MSRRRRASQVDGPFVIHSHAMRRSPAWEVLTPNDKGVLEALEDEHMTHGGTRNGRLVRTYDQLTPFVTKRQAIPKCLRRLEALGFIAITRSGYLKGGGKRPPSKYRLTYLSGRDDNTVGAFIPAPSVTNDWQSLETAEDVGAALAHAERVRGAASAKAAAPYPPKSVDSSAPPAPSRAVPVEHLK